ncbi:MAG: hypothetical protein MRJ65_09400 [Candidatus Brocadiaceae bacterium]|nr:hypothetical protein [Candidatus Brocadiaceae bacterium]
MKRSLAVIMVASLIFFSSNLSSIVADEGEKLENPWILEEDQTLHKLMKNGYRVVGCTTTTINGRPTEIIYVQYLDKLYRCITTEDGKFSTHYCQSLKSQKKVEKEREKSSTPVKNNKKAKGDKERTATPARP